MINKQKAEDINEKLLEEATFWHARIDDVDANESIWLSFTDWLDADDLHRQAYDKVEEFSIDLQDMVGPAKKIVDELITGSENEQVAEGNVIQTAWRWRNLNVWGGLAAAVAVIMLVTANVNFFADPQVVTQQFMTGFGEQQLVRLDDGSTVRLNVNSKLEVTFEAGSRRTHLAYGEVIFSVAKDKERPFFVGVGDRQIRVVGTKFNVLRHQGQVTVTVAEGIVDVSPEDDRVSSSKLESARLTAGKQLIHIDGANNSVVMEIDPDAALTWEEGILAYDEVPLTHIISELNRYFEHPIKIEGDVSHIAFSGILNVQDQGIVLQLLEETLPIKVTLEDNVIMVVAIDK